jgi:iron(III) transport system ATP-binding protein
MGDRTLAVAGLAKSYDGAPALVAADLAAEAGTVVAVLGPSGSGKSTLLRCIAGLERPDAGTIRIGGEVVFGDGADVAPERRGVGMVFQDWALFPHLDVRDNVGYGLPRAERRGPRVGEVLEMVGLAGSERRMPGTLSGGQQQRVALARALAPRPGVLLLDEPFSNLDASLRTRIRDEVHRLLLDVGITTVFVTHDQGEAFVLGDTVALVHDGRVVQHAPPHELYREPVSPWAAAFVGDANLLEGTATGRHADTVLGPIELADEHHGAITVLIRPEDLVVAADGDEGSVTRVDYLGHDSLLRVTSREVSLLVRTRSDVWRRGDAVSLRFAGRPATAWPTG